MIISIIFILSIILGIGLPLVLLVCPKINSILAIGISFPLGIGVFTLVMFVGNILGFKFSFLNESLILLFISSPLIFVSRKRIKSLVTGLVRSFKECKLAPIEKVTLSVLLFLIATSLINTLYWPVHIWDSLVLYDFRGHVFAQTGFMKDAFVDAYYYGYPLLTSLAHAIVYLAGGSYPQFLYSLFYLSLGLGFYGSLREFVSRKISLIFTLVLLVSQPLFYHSLISYTNLPFTVYLFLGSISVFLWDKKRQVGYLILSALLIGLSTWTRSVEPFWLAILFVVSVVSIYRKKIWNIAAYSLFFFPIREIWIIFQDSLVSKDVATPVGIGKYIKFLPEILNVTRWSQVFGYLYIHVVTPWGAIFILYIFATVVLFLLKKQRKLFLIFFITFTLLSILIVGTFTLSLVEADWFRIGDAAERLSMLFYPLFIYTSALVMDQLSKKHFN